MLLIYTAVRSQSEHWTGNTLNRLIFPYFLPPISQHWIKVRIIIREMNEKMDHDALDHKNQTFTTLIERKFSFIYIYIAKIHAF